MRPSCAGKAESLGALIQQALRLVTPFDHAGTDDLYGGWVLGVKECHCRKRAGVEVFFILLALGQWRAQLKPALRSYIIYTGVAVVLVSICFGIVLHTDYLTPSAIVVAGEADVRNGPLDESPSIYKVRDGAELNVIDQKDGWLQVVDSAQRAGWLRRDQVIVFAQTRS